MVGVAVMCARELQLSCAENANDREETGSNETENPMSSFGILAVANDRKPQKTPTPNP
jgi:hypothetical protein